jgi:predicted DNA-binding protein
MATPGVNFVARLPLALKEALEALAAKTGKSQNQIVVEALEAYLREQI